MSLLTVEFNGNIYPEFQTNGNAARFCMAFAKEVLKGDVIFDIGYGNEEWKFPGAIGIDKKDGSEFHAMNLPPLQADGIFSSHLLEHTDNWVDCLLYWTTKLKSGGVLFMYLPDYSQHYWRVWNNRKHVHTFFPALLKDFLISSGLYTKTFVSGIDAYNSFTVMAEKI